VADEKGGKGRELEAKLALRTALARRGRKRFISLTKTSSARGMKLFLGAALYRSPDTKMFRQCEFLYYENS